ncbi:MAG: hypothetical protein WCX82_03365 [archaeon]|jgi:hypothetical protein
MKKILIFAFLLLFCGTIFAADFFVSDLVVPKTVVEKTDFNINLLIVNNSSTDEEIDINLQLFSPGGVVIRTYIINQDVNSNSTYDLLKIITGTDTNASNSPYLIRATITDSGDTNPSNNVTQEHFVIIKAAKATPIPDMPVYFGLAIGLVAVIFLINNKQDKR